MKTDTRRRSLAVLLWLAAGPLLPGGALAQASGGGAEEPPAPWDWARPTVPIELSGYFWTDTGFMRRTNAQPGQYDQDATYMQGRFVLRARYRRTVGAYFGEARLELAGLVNEYSRSQYEPHVLDAYLAFGQERWSVLLGRFLAWEVYYRGQGIELYTAEEAGALGGPALSWLELARGHRNQSGQAAVQAQPLGFLRLQVAGVYGQENNQNHLGVRPAADLNLGALKLIGGWEYLRQSPQTSADKVKSTSRGWAARVQYSFAPAGSPWLRAPASVTFSEEVRRGWTGPVATVGAEIAQASIDVVDIQGLEDSDKTLDKTTVGGFVDLTFGKSSIGLGYHRTMQENVQGEKNTHDQAFVSYLHRLPLEGLTVKAVYGFARAHVEDVDTGSEWDNDLQSVRVRVAYDFP